MPLNLAEINQQYIVQKICLAMKNSVIIWKLSVLWKTLLFVFFLSFSAITSSWSGKVRSQSALILRE